MTKKISEVHLQMVSDLEAKVMAEQTAQIDLSSAILELQDRIDELQIQANESDVELSKAESMLSDVKKIK